MEDVDDAVGAFWWEVWIQHMVALIKLSVKHPLSSYPSNRFTFMRLRVHAPSFARKCILPRFLLGIAPSPLR